MKSLPVALYDDYRVVGVQVHYSLQVAFGAARTLGVGIQMNDR